VPSYLVDHHKIVFNYGNNAKQMKKMESFVGLRNKNWRIDVTTDTLTFTADRFVLLLLITF